MRTEILLLACVTLVHALVAPCRGDSEKPLSAEWRLLENRPDNSYHAELVLHNTTAQPLKGPWSLYFNASSRLSPESVAKPYLLEHINGDFYVLRAPVGASEMAAGAKVTIEYSGSPWAINVSDAPSGLYWILGDVQIADSLPQAVSLQIAPFPKAGRIVRGAADEVPAVTPESRFAENERLTLLSPQEVPRVIPTPAQTKNMAGTFSINLQTVIVADAALANEAKILAEAFGGLLDAPIRVVNATEQSTNAIRLQIGEVQIAGVRKVAGDEAYSLSIDPKTGIDIVGTDDSGVFYAIQSLRALAPPATFRKPLPSLEIEAIRIEDAPRFRYRGLHLDVARNFQSKDTIKKLLDLMAFYKLNRFHWHLTDDEGWRIEIKSLPELMSVGSRRGHTLDEQDSLIPSFGSGADVADRSDGGGTGHYTQDDMIEILRFAADRHIQVIPEIDVPGHSRAAIKAMEARAKKLATNGRDEAAQEFRLIHPGDESHYESIQMWRDNVIDVGLDSSYRFLEVVVSELADIYRRAGVPLEVIHLGGDEVPHGAWEQSPACRAIAVESERGLTRNQQLQLHFLERASELLVQDDIRPACWEDCLLFATHGGRLVAEMRDTEKVRPVVYVWNNVWGWGREDAAYRLANAGYDVVLCNATHLYLDLAYEKDPTEVGYYWADFVGERKPFEFNPLDVFQNAASDSMGRKLPADGFASRTQLTDNGRSHVLGIQGELWGENLRGPEQLEYMAFPRLIALAERAWAPEPAWTQLEDPVEREHALQIAWNRFANTLGQRELPRLDYFHGGVAYRLPPPGAVSRDGMAHANVSMPGLTIRYTSDGSQPGADSPIYTAPLPFDTAISFRAFDTRDRGGRATTILRPAGE